MRNMDLMNENLSLMNKINSIEQRDKNTNRSFTPNKPPKMHEFSDHQVIQINNTNKILANKLNKVNNTINNKHINNDIQYLSKNVSKFGKKENLLQTINKQVIKLPYINKNPLYN